MVEIIAEPVATPVDMEPRAEPLSLETPAVVEKEEVGPQRCAHCLKKPVSRRSYCGQACQIRSHFRRGFQLDWFKDVLTEKRASVCGLEGCELPVEKAKKLRKRTAAAGYCSEDHRRIAVSPCLKCKSKLSEGTFCTSECIKELSTSKKTLLLEVPRSHDLFQQMETKFNTTWYPSPAMAPKILHLYHIVVPKPLYDRYIQYRDGEGGKMEELRWHGTIRNCRVGDRGNTTFCDNFKACYLCSILVHSFDASKSHCGGIFTAATSAYSNSYSRDSKRSTTKAMLLGAVSHYALGNPIVFTPRNETVRPAYLLIYNAK